jgi:hypothetical protein
MKTNYGKILTEIYALMEAYNTDHKNTKTLLYLKSMDNIYTLSLQIGSTTHLMNYEPNESYDDYIIAQIKTVVDRFLNEKSMMYDCQIIIVNNKESALEIALEMNKIKDIMVFDDVFENKIIRILKRYRRISHSELVNMTQTISKQERQRMLDELIGQGKIIVESDTSCGRQKKVYSIIEDI